MKVQANPGVTSWVSVGWAPGSHVLGSEGQPLIVHLQGDMGFKTAVPGRPLLRQPVSHLQVLYTRKKKGVITYFIGN